MKTEKTDAYKSTNDANTVIATVNPPSPELTDFIKFLGQVLAQEWLEQNQR